MVPMECKLTHYGGEYLGKKTVSRSGNPCLPWLSRVSSDNQYDNVLPAFSDSLDSRHNFCRNPDGAIPSPWCWTTTHGKDPQMEECDIPFCFELLLEYPSNSPPECKLTVSGGEYAGRKNETNWGLPCQSWNISGNHGFIEEMNRWAAFSDNALEDGHNFCRGKTLNERCTDHWVPADLPIVLAFPSALGLPSGHETKALLAASRALAHDFSMRILPDLDLVPLSFLRYLWAHMNQLGCLLTPLHQLHPLVPMSL
ncbi:unnamed protein product [Darwinula stevensoni]|uniref:Kringle domain-containing protein n=1 Tax=Darwinula stevensoni TaxID=69355 RepID=A0A7R9AD43_9CRUS|nr:unnamed protein product [Darwinula stevensoni]CAG0900940.1 unnamed protein product [Darwinula stevensoni]